MVSKVDIGNRALQKCGVGPFGRITSFDDDSKEAAEINTAYEPLRRAELRRNFWTFALKRRILRASLTTDKVMIPDDWAIGTTYAVNDLVVYAGKSYLSLQSSNLANVPSTATTFWEPASGPLIAKSWDSGFVYYRGEVVWVTTHVWLALTNTTAGTSPVEGSEWHEIEDNTLIETPYRAPVSGRTYTFVLPDDFLRLAPRDPRRSLDPPDYLIENRQIISDDPSPIFLRYVRDEEDTTKFDAMFVEALASSIAKEIVEPITQSNSKVAAINADYARAMGDARLVDAIETGPTESEEDDWIIVRR